MLVGKGQGQIWGVHASIVLVLGVNRSNNWTSNDQASICAVVWLGSNKQELICVVLRCDTARGVSISLLGERNGTTMSKSKKRAPTIIMIGGIQWVCCTHCAVVG